MNLHHILRRFEASCTKIETLINEAIKVQDTNKLAFSAYSEHAIIKLHDMWTTHCRQLVLYSCYGSISTLSGMVLPRSPIVRSSVDPLDWLRKNWATNGNKMGKTWEPDWHIPDQCLRSARLFQIANYTTVANALGAILVTDQLRFTRNAVVHSLPVTYLPFRKMVATFGFSTKVLPSDFIYYRIGSSGPMLIDNWISELKLCIAAAIQ